MVLAFSAPQQPRAVFQYTDTHHFSTPPANDNVQNVLRSSLEQANNLREVQAMKRLSPHANIIQLHELIL